MIDTKAVAKKLQSLREKNSLSQEQLASELYVTRQAVSRWETGLSLPSIDLLLKLCELYKVSFDEILCLQEKMQINENDLFGGYNRLFIVKSIIESEIKVNLDEVFYQFSPEERMIVLKAIKENRYECNISDLWVKLTNAEQKYLGGIKK